jgi:hypothetical protein
LRNQFPTVRTETFADAVYAVMSEGADPAGPGFALAHQLLAAGSSPDDVANWLRAAFPDLSPAQVQAAASSQPGTQGGTLSGPGLAPLDFALILARADFTAAEVAHELLRKPPQHPFGTLPYLLMRVGFGALQVQQALAACVADAQTVGIQPAPPEAAGTTPLWRVPLGGADGPPGQVLYCSSSQAGLPERLIASGDDVLLIDPANGQVTFALDRRLAAAVGDGVVYAFDPAGRTLSAVDTTGRTLWQVGAPSGACTVGDHAVFVLDPSNGAVTALEKASGQTLWTRNHLNAPVRAGGLAAGSGKVVYRYVLQPHVCALHALDQQTGELSWQFQPDLNIDSQTLGLQPNLVIEDGIVFFAAQWIYFLDAATGATVNTCSSWKQSSRQVEWAIDPRHHAVFLGTDDQVAYLASYRSPSATPGYYPNPMTASRPPNNQAHTRPFFYNDGSGVVVYDLGGQGHVDRLDLSHMFQITEVNPSAFCSIPLQTVSVAVHGNTLYYLGAQVASEPDPSTGLPPTPAGYLLALRLP